jgi:uncharacterized protein (TIGR03086 family)
MREISLIGSAVPPTVAVVRGVKPDQLDAPTPCREWTVRQVLDHLLEWGPALVAAGRKAEPATAGAGDLEAIYDDLVAAWSDPAAWQGTTRVGGPQELPAAMIGGMVLGEVVIHGWDLARATGQDVDWDPGLLEVVHREIVATAEMGRGMGIYGPPVPVPDDRPILARTLGLTGRDPDWTPCP